MFVVIGFIGAALLVLSLVFDDVIDGLVPDAGWFSGPVIGACLAAFGVFGWMAQEGGNTSVTVASFIGIGGGLVLGWITYRLARLLMNAPTDPTPTTASVIGHEATVITPVRANGFGEVLVTMSGQPTKLAATSTVDLPAGTTVIVVATESSTKVVVEAADTFWQ